MTLLVDMTKVEEKSIRVLEFTGRHEDWKVWSVKFLARGNKNTANVELERLLVTIFAY